MSEIEREEIQVLAALEGAKNTVKEISRFTGIAKDRVEALLFYLSSKGLVRKEERRGLLGSKEYYYLTEKGKEMLAKAKKELEKVAERLKQAKEVGDEQTVEEIVEEYATILPLFAMWGFLDLAFLSMLGLHSMRFDEEFYGEEDFFGEEFSV